MEILAQENLHICLKLYEEIIQLMANKVKDTIMAEVKTDGYFSVDSTSDISHTDQLTLIIRYVSPEDGLPTEGFLTFLELKDHSGESIADLVFNYITTELKIDFRKCRGQSYDNAANMDGTFNDALESNLGRRASVYDDVVKIFSFLADLTLSKVELQRGVELLMQEYPEDVNQNLKNYFISTHMYYRNAELKLNKSFLFNNRHNYIMEGEIKRQISQMLSRRRTSINVAAMLNPGRKSIFSDPKLKVFRELNHDDVTEEHRKFFNMVAYHFNLTEDEVENSALSSPNVNEYSHMFKIKFSLNKF
ncbi:zinc finger MYM-type protein 1 [Caerostris darwini]|uniref:Zinc finger MYM-type protein 1 n=1 Tax=Caerostris darwini TaxID=1538125 RepID=A0AAV4R3M5_9ARAC|nr:zinc finger MYM-type protein 1 [Caerostris darwini]